MVGIAIDGFQIVSFRHTCQQKVCNACRTFTIHVVAILIVELKGNRLCISLLYPCQVKTQVAAGAHGQAHVIATTIPSYI